jgi:GNAT superfamily N-acetyltransferase
MPSRTARDLIGTGLGLACVGVPMVGVVRATGRHLSHRRAGLAPYPVRMQTASIDVYVGAAVARWDVMRRPGQMEVEEPGVRGLLPCTDDPLIRLLVTDDRAYGVLAALLPDAEAGMLNVFAAAARCAGIVNGDSAWKSESVTAMIYRDLRTVPAVPLPSELTLRSVLRVNDDAPDGVPLEDAVAAAMLADPTIGYPPEVFADFLRSLPPAIRLFAAVDGDGAVRATSGSGAFGTEASVIFVSTDPDWRGRGIGLGMTAAALRAAKDCGAKQACLDATDVGLSIYLRLGFEAVGRATHFSRARPASRGQGLSVRQPRVTSAR